VEYGDTMFVTDASKIMAPEIAEAQAFGVQSPLLAHEGFDMIALVSDCLSII
jgi:hypothetical protein